MLTELNKSGRPMTAMIPMATTLNTTTTGTVDVVMVKIDPNRICWVAPVVAFEVVSK